LRLYWLNALKVFFVKLSGSKTEFSVSIRTKADSHQQSIRSLISAKMVLSMSTPSLKEFTQAIPVCSQTSGLAAVLEIFCTSGCDAIVVLSEQQRPLGVINLRQVLPYLMPRTSGKGSVATTGEVDKPISQIEPPLIEPLTILPAHLN
jgi:hypothetical protein